LKKIFKINKKDIDCRLDKWLKSNFSSLNQSFIEKNIRKKYILVNNQKKTASYRLNEKDIITIFNFNQESYKHEVCVKNYKIPRKTLDLFKSSIIFENNNFIILNKWTGIASQGGSKITIAIDHVIKSISSSYNLVHRLDKETSGLLIIAKNLEYTKIFGNLFRNQQVKKKYIAICQGKPSNLESIIQLDISDKLKINQTHKTRTYYKVLKVKDNLSQILFIPHTGKTHQLRLVSKKLGCPIVGDNKYNYQKKFKNEKMKLNAFEICFTIKGNKYNFSSLLPDHFNDFIKKNNLKSIKLF